MQIDKKSSLLFDRQWRVSYLRQHLSWFFVTVCLYLCNYLTNQDRVPIALAAEECYVCLEKCDDPLQRHACRDDGLSEDDEIKCYSIEVVSGNLHKLVNTVLQCCCRWFDVSRERMSSGRCRWRGVRQSQWNLGDKVYSLWHRFV